MTVLGTLLRPVAVSKMSGNQYRQAIFSTITLGHENDISIAPYQQKLLFLGLADLLI